MTVGNGSRTFFWTHTWLGTSPLIEAALGPVNEDMQANTVGDMWQSNGWKWDEILPLISQDTKLLFDGYTVMSGMENEDGFHWAVSPSSNFTIKSA